MGHVSDAFFIDRERAVFNNVRTSRQGPAAPEAEGEGMRLNSGAGLSRRTLLILGIAPLGLLALLALALFNGRSHETNAALAHDPAKPRRAARVYDEKLDGRRYVNRDLALALEGPRDWKLDLGRRADDQPAYEGLVVKMEPAAPPDPASGVRPLISVVKRSLPAGANGGPVDYIRKNLHAAAKKIVEEPREDARAGRTVGRVVYEMKSAEGAILVVQVVHVEAGRAIILSAMAPSKDYPGLQATFEQVFASLRLGS